MKILPGSSLPFFLTLLLAVSACSSSNDDDDAPAEGDATGVVETRPYACVTKDGSETDISCEVTVSDVWVTPNTLAITINAYSVGRALPTVCETSDDFTDPGFDEAVKSELRAMIEANQIGWSVDAVTCAAVP